MVTSASSRRLGESGEGTPLRVLILDDCPDEASALVRELEKGGYAPDWKRVETPGEMDDALATSAWDVILSEYRTPRLDAGRALAAARAAGSDAPFVVVTGKVAEDVAVGMMKAGAHDCVMKGNLARLCATVERGLHDAQQRRERRGDRERLRQSEERYRAVIEQATDGIYLLDAQTRRLVATNPSFQRMLGYSAEELQDLPVYDFVAHMRQDVDATIGRTLRERRRVVGGRKYRRKDGTLVDVEVGVSVITHGGRETICTIVRDVTERKRNEEKLRASEAELRAVFGAMNDVILVLDAGGRYLKVAPTDPSLLFKPPEELLGKTLHDTFPREKADVLLRCVRQSLEHKKRVALEYSLPVRGQQRWFSGTVSPMLEGVAVVVVRDITGRKRAEEDLRRSEERFKGLAEATFEGIAITPDDTIAETNAAFASMFGYEPEEIIGLTQMDITAPESRETVREARAAGSQEPFEIVGLRKDGTEFDIEVRGKLTTYRGRPARVTAIRDITERKRAEEALRQSERLYRAVLEQATEPIFLVDFRTRRIVEANPAFGETFGYFGESMGRMTLYDLVAADRESVDANVRSVMQRENPFAGVRKRVRQYRRNDGSLVDVEVSASTILRHGRETLCVVVHDVTERVRAQALLEERVTALSKIASSLSLDAPVEKTLQAMAETAVSASTASTCTVMLADDEGAGEVRIVGSHGLPDGYAAALQDTMRTALRAGISSPTLSALRERRPLLLRERLGEKVADQPHGQPLHRFVGRVAEDTVYIVPLIFGTRAIGAINFGFLPSREPDEDEKVFLGAVADQTAVAIENARLLAHARDKAALGERQRLARELHDSVSQALYGIALDAKTARALLRRDPDRAAESLDYVLSLAGAGMAEMRALIFELRPESLETEGLVAALQKQATALKARHGVEVEARLDEEPVASLEVKETLYRVAQEALHNTVKHARASGVRIVLKSEAAAVLLEISDDGTGFDAGRDFPGHLGLRSMRERASRLGGTLRIDSSPGDGTLIRIRIPV